MERRAFLLASAASIGSAALASSALGESPPDIPLGTAIRNILDQSFYFTDGAPSDKVAYVFYAPWCPYCKAAFTTSRSTPDAMQLRWIGIKPRGQDQAFMVGAANTMLPGFEFSSLFTPVAAAPDVPLHLVNASYRQNFWVHDVMVRTAGKARFMSLIGTIPDIIWTKSDGVLATKQSAGVETSKDIREQIIARGILPASDEVGQAQIRADILAGADIPTYRAPKPQYYALEDTVGYALPDSRSMVAHQMTKNQILNSKSAAVALDGSQWIELQILTDKSKPGVYVNYDHLAVN